MLKNDSRFGSRYHNKAVVLALICCRHEMIVAPSCSAVIAAPAGKLFRGSHLSQNDARAIQLPWPMKKTHEGTLYVAVVVGQPAARPGRGDDVFGRFVFCGAVSSSTHPTMKKMNLFSLSHLYSPSLFYGCTVCCLSSPCL